MNNLRNSKLVYWEILIFYFVLFINKLFINNNKIMAMYTNIFEKYYAAALSNT